MGILLLPFQLVYTCLCRGRILHSRGRVVFGQIFHESYGMELRMDWAGLGVVPGLWIPRKVPKKHLNFLFLAAQSSYTTTHVSMCVSMCVCVSHFSLTLEIFWKKKKKKNLDLNFAFWFWLSQRGCPPPWAPFFPYKPFFEKNNNQTSIEWIGFTRIAAQCVTECSDTHTNQNPK